MGIQSAQIINYLLFVVLLLMFSKTIRQTKSLGNGKGYVDAYSKVLSGDKDANEVVDKFIEKEKQDYLIHQAYLLKAYLKLESGEDPKGYLEKIDVNKIFLDERGRFSKAKYTNSLSFFLWVNLFIAKCINLNRLDLVNDINEMMGNQDDLLNNYLDYRLYKGIYNGVIGNKNDDYHLLKQLVDGEYPALTYEKKYIGLYKREASAFLRYFRVTIDEFWENDLHTFADTSVGKRLMSDLGLYKKYHIEKEVEPIPSDGEEEDK